MRIEMPEIRKKYDREFREGAVRIVEETGRPIAQVARDLGVLPPRAPDSNRPGLRLLNVGACPQRIPGAKRVAACESHEAGHMVPRLSAWSGSRPTQPRRPGWSGTWEPRRFEP